VLLTLGQNYSDGIKDHIRGLIVPLAFLGMHTAESQGKYFYLYLNTFSLN
jgi:hypothetical protein